MFPFWSSVREAYRSAFADPRTVLRASLVWIAISMVLNVIVLALGAGAPMPASGATASGTFWLRLLLGLLLPLVDYTGGIAFAVAWHRNVLLDERPGWSSAWRFKRREWRFLGYGLAVGLTVGAVGAVILIPFGLLFSMALASSGGIVKYAGISAIMVLGFGTATFIGTRLVLGFPAIAVEEPRGVWAAPGGGATNAFGAYFWVVSSARFPTLSRRRPLASSQRGSMSIP